MPRSWENLLGICVSAVVIQVPLAGMVERGEHVWPPPELNMATIGCHRCAIPTPILLPQVCPRLTLLHSPPHIPSSTMANGQSIAHRAQRHASALDSDEKASPLPYSVLSSCAAPASLPTCLLSILLRILCVSPCGAAKNMSRRWACGDAARRKHM